MICRVYELFARLMLTASNLHELFLLSKGPVLFETAVGQPCLDFSLTKTSVNLASSFAPSQQIQAIKIEQILALQMIYGASCR